jgi:hypothetical protein
MNKYRIKAILEILGMFALAATIGFSLSVIATYFTTEQTIAGLGFLVLSYCVYVLYTIRVDQLKSLDDLTKDRK